MLIAFDKNENRIVADKAMKEETYYCPLCGNELILRQGSINVPHFAHKSAECDDKWNYDMSEWHYDMQSRFPIEQREFVVKYGDQTHRADILNEKQVIEFQHSSISPEEISERNNFYKSAGYNIAWVFDVQEQYDSRAIYAVDHSDALMYGWSNPKRCLQCFPRPKEGNKSLIIYLYWVDEDSVECFNRIIWSTANENGQPNFKRFIISEYSIDCTIGHLSVSDFFITKQDILGQHLSKINYQPQKKYCGVKGHRRDEYICPITNHFGLKLSGEHACSYCKHCAAINEVYERSYEIYCCYPNQVNEVDNPHSGYECSNVLRI